MQILVVEDDNLSRELTTRAVNHWGYKARSAKDGGHAIRLFEEGYTPEIILTDWMMPGVDGIEVCKYIKTHFTQPNYIILITAKALLEDSVSAFEAGVDDYITKPVDLKLLKSRVNAGKRVINYQQQLLERNDDLAKLNEEKNRFIGIAAHDLRNPLVSIRGFSELLLTDSLTAEQTTEFTKIINQQSQYMLDLISDLLDISMIESGKLELKIDIVNLNQLIKKRFNLFSVRAEQKNIKMIYQHPDQIDVLCDDGKISQVMDNLISNAIKFSPENKKITITLEEIDNHAEISVKDEGPGLTIEQQNNLFTEFSDIGNKPTAGEKSTGLGLSIVKKIVAAHNGTIIATSYEGYGATFSFSLPMA